MGLSQLSLKENSSISHLTRNQVSRHPNCISKPTGHGDCLFLWASQELQLVEDVVLVYGGWAEGPEHVDFASLEPFKQRQVRSSDDRAKDFKKNFQSNCSTVSLINLLIHLASQKLPEWWFQLPVSSPAASWGGVPSCEGNRVHLPSTTDSHWEPATRTAAAFMLMLLSLRDKHLWTYQLLNNVELLCYMRGE